jgi:hypothetical protein
MTVSNGWTPCGNPSNSCDTRGECILRVDHLVTLAPLIDSAGYGLTPFISHNFYFWCGVCTCRYRELKTQKRLPPAGEN